LTGTAYLSAIPPGTRIEEYQITSVLGQGSFGITYLAEDVNLGASIAIKEYLPGDWAFRDSTQTVRPKSTHLSDSFERGQESFLKEARLLARVAHPNIVKVRRFFRAHGTAYIAMDFLQGKSLGEILNDDYPQGGYPSAALKRLLNAVLGGLGAIHDAGIVHRDIKPGNVVIDLNGNPILVDFGAARNYDRTLAQGMTVIVTPGYAPIEQYSDDGEQGPFTDIYAVGALAYRAITGRPPDEPYKRLGRNSWIPASVAGVGRYPPAILEAIDWALAVQPQDRPQTAAMLLERLRNAPDSVTAPAGEPTQLISEATQILDLAPSRSRRHTAEARSEPSAARLHRARELSIEPGVIKHPQARETVAAPKRNWPPLAAAAFAAMVLMGGVGWFVWPRAPLDPLAASRFKEERTAEPARKAAAEAEATRAEAERQSADKAEAQHQAAARAEAERQAAEGAKVNAAQEADRQAAAKAETERQTAAKAEADRQAAAAKLRVDRESAEAARQEAARQAAAEAEADRQTAAEAARQKAEAQKTAAKAEADRKAAATAAEKKATADQAKPLKPSRVADERCTAILQDAQLMGGISDDDKSYLREHCH
jgi:serine/threonine protein kinase